MSDKNKARDEYRAEKEGIKEYDSCLEVGAKSFIYPFMFSFSMVYMYIASSDASK